MKRINFETAKLANEAGYKLKGFVSGYAKLDKEFFDFIIIGHEDFYAAPYQAELQEWLRDEHGVIVLVEYSKFYEIPWFVCIQKLQDDYIEEYMDFNNYEEALEEGLLQALKIVIDAKNIM